MRVLGETDIRPFMATHAAWYYIIDKCAAGGTTGGWVEWEGFRVELTVGEC